jgi:FMN phosphatase YigB (HAD superfamily)
LSRPYPEVTTVLASLAPHFHCGVIANQVPGLARRLAEWGIDRFFDVVVSSGELGVEKPDPRIFTYALDQARCVASQAVMIGDRPDNDIWPAAAVGMRTLWVRQGVGGLMIVPDVVAPDVTGAGTGPGAGRAMNQATPDATVDNLAGVLEVLLPKVGIALEVT